MAFLIKRHDLKPAFRRVLTEDGNTAHPLDLTGCVVWFIMTALGASTPTIQAQATMLAFNDIYVILAVIAVLMIPSFLLLRGAGSSPAAAH